MLKFWKHGKVVSTIFSRNIGNMGNGQVKKIYYIRIYFSSSMLHSLHSSFFLVFCSIMLASLQPQQDQFYLLDSGFPNMPGYLAPFRKTRYHLRDFRDGGRPRGKQELFNHRHSSLRNVIESCFGVLKARFPILKMMSNYPVRR
ncbi:unnamed protein product [Lupinus luteus]|uniref:DDE Tnp4 domain-containing protein n=1 Tax=Lupinus luteus TaxID=3873 RepID=A0AAV1XDX1_LUPLU